MQVRTVRELGALVRDRREALGLTQRQLAERASVTREWLLRFEQGKSTVPLAKVLDVLAVLDLVVEVNTADG